jgi:RNA polymerase primary sigma factor
MSPSEATISMDLADQTRKILATLTPREEKVLRMRFGISDRLGAVSPDENVPVDIVESNLEEPEIIEEEPSKKAKNSSRKRVAK